VAGDGCKGVKRTPGNVSVIPACFNAAMTTAFNSYDEDAMAATLAFCDAIARTIAIARKMLDAGESVDLTGLDNGIGLLCAKTLDLPPAMGRALRPRLTAVLDALEDMFTAFNRQNAG
jgi:hypothetical protein